MNPLVLHREPAITPTRPPTRAPLCELRIYTSAISFGIAIMAFFSETSIYATVTSSSAFWGPVVIWALILVVGTTVLDVIVNDLMRDRWSIGIIAKERGFLNYFHAALHASFSGVIVAQGYGYSATAILCFQIIALTYIGVADVRARHIVPRQIAEASMYGRRSGDNQEGAQCDDLTCL